MSVAQPCHFHPKEDTRLCCSECNLPVCPKCMVMCEVGHKCPDCVGKRKSHTVEIGAYHLMTVAVGGLLAGGTFGYMANEVYAYHPGLWMAIIGIFLSAAVGQWVGQAIQKLAKYKMGKTLANVVSLSAIAGILLSPFMGAVFQLVQLLSDPALQQVGIYEAVPLMLIMVATAVFINRLRQPFEG